MGVRTTTSVEDQTGRRGWKLILDYDEDDDGVLVTLRSEWDYARPDGSSSPQVVASARIPIEDLLRAFRVVLDTP